MQGEINNIAEGVKNGSYRLSDGSCQVNNSGSKGFTSFEPSIESQDHDGKPGLTVTAKGCFGVRSCQQKCVWHMGHAFKSFAFTEEMRRRRSLSRRGR